MAGRHPISPFEERLGELLRRVAEGTESAEAAVKELRDLPFTDLGFARVDHHRELRQGACEVVFGQGKTVAQVVAVVGELLAGNAGPVLVSRASTRQRRAVRAMAEAEGLPVDERARSGALAIARNVPAPAGLALVVTAGTAALPV